MSKNSSITNFFKPVPRVSASPRQSQSQSQSETPTQTQSTASTASSQPLSSPTPPPLLPHTSFSPSPAPPPPPSTVRDRNQEIRGSDDEDDDNFSDSDDDLFPDLFAPAPAASTLPAQPPVTRKDPNLMGTPRAKRPAVEFHSSPLTINTRHKFDINALLKHAKVDDAIEVSQQRTAALLQGSPSTTRTAAPGAAQDPLAAETSLHDAMLNMLPDPGDSQDEATRSRLLRAVKRTEAGVGKKEWFFFDKQPEQQQQQTKRTENQHVPAAFPKSKATGVWFILADKHRSEAFEDGLAYNVQCRLQNLPDEIFEWVLREAPWEKSRQLRDEYVRLLGACSDQIERQLTQDMVMDLFRDLGASDRALWGPTPSSSSGAEPEQQGALYPEQSRYRLETVLRILEATAHAANGEVLTQTVSILLRLGIDNLVREDQTIATAYQDALFQLISSVSPRAWNSFCGDVTTSLYTHTSSATLRWNAVSSIPLLSARLSELRRRMALVFVFDDPRRAYSPAAETFSIRSVIDRLEHADEFLIDRSVTDYAELFALCEMLSVAVGDGNPPEPDATSPEAIRQHNADVDELTRKVKHMVSNIHEQGAAYMSRMEVRGQLKDFERKLQHVVRTRPKPKEDIFGLVRGEDEEEVERPKQQAFMKRFLAKGKQAAT